MNPRFALISLAVMAMLVSAAAQQTAQQQGTTQNHNSSQMQVTPAKPSQAPAGAVTTNTSEKNASANEGTPTEESAASAETLKTTTKTPHTEMYGTPSTGPLSADPLLQPGPLPPNRSTLIGGLAKKVDGIRNRVVIAPFGSRQTVTVQFDERTHIYRDSHETTILGIKKGNRVYADTMLVGPQVFARNLRVVTSMSPAEASGQIVAYDARSQTARIVDKLTGTPVSFRITKETELRSKTGQPTTSDIQPGALVSVVFAPGQNGGDARQILILAVPGTRYIFAGRITNFDIHAGVVDVDNESDGRNYELRFPPSMENRGELRVGAQIAANATFDGRTYTTQQITIVPSRAESAEQ